VRKYFNTLLEGLDQGHLHPLEHPRLMRLRRWFEHGTSCTAGEHFMQKAIRTASLSAIWHLSLCYFIITVMLTFHYRYLMCHNSFTVPSSANSSCRWQDKH
jgi:hypothetical protein